MFALLNVFARVPLSSLLRFLLERELNGDHFQGGAGLQRIPLMARYMVLVLRYVFKTIETVLNSLVFLICALTLAECYTDQYLYGLSD